MYGVLDSDGTECKANCRRYADPTGIATNEMHIFKTDAAGKRKLGTKTFLPVSLSPANEVC